MPRRKDCTAPGRAGAGGAGAAGSGRRQGGGAGRRLGLGPNLASVPPSLQQLGLGCGSRPRPAQSPAGCWAMGGSLTGGPHGRWVDSPAPRGVRRSARGSEEGPRGRVGSGRTSAIVSLGALRIRHGRCGQEGAIRRVLRPPGCRPWPRAAVLRGGEGGLGVGGAAPEGGGLVGCPWGWGGGTGQVPRAPSQSGGRAWVIEAQRVPQGWAPGRMGTSDPSGCCLALASGPRPSCGWFRAGGPGGHRSWGSVQREGRGRGQEAARVSSVPGCLRWRCRLCGLWRHSGPPGAGT